MTTRTDEELHEHACKARGVEPDEIYRYGRDVVDRTLAACRDLYDLGRADADDERLRLAWQWCIVARDADERRAIALTSAIGRVATIRVHLGDALAQLAQASTDVERLTRERDEAVRERKATEHRLDDASKAFDSQWEKRKRAEQERDEARADRDAADMELQIARETLAEERRKGDAERLTKERDEARAERDRLTALLSSATTRDGLHALLREALPVSVAVFLHEAPGTMTVTTCAAVDAEQARAMGIRDAIYAAEYVRVRPMFEHHDASKIAAELADEHDRMRAEQKAEPRAKVGPWVDIAGEQRARYYDDDRRDRRIAALMQPDGYWTLHADGCEWALRRATGGEAAADAALRERGLL